MLKEMNSSAETLMRAATMGMLVEVDGSDELMVGGGVKAVEPATKPVEAGDMSSESLKTRPKWNNFGGKILHFESPIPVKKV